MTHKYTIETERETDGRWIAEIVELAGVLAYGNTLEEAHAKVEALAFRVLADEIEENTNPIPVNYSRVIFSRV